MRAVLDTNVLTSAFKDPPGRVTPLWRAARQRRYRLVISPAIMREVADVLRRKLGWEEPRIRRRLKQLSRVAELVQPEITVSVITDDPPDNRILECAVAGRADVIVSGDRHLRKLKSYEGIPIIRPVDFRRSLGLVA
jgi:uncharacterized protein